MAFGREAKAVETPAAHLDLTTKLFGTQIRFFNHFNKKKRISAPVVGFDAAGTAGLETLWQNIKIN